MSKNNIANFFIKSPNLFGWIAFFKQITSRRVINETAKINIAHAVVPLKQWYLKWVTGTAIPVTCDFTRRSGYGQR